MRGVSLSRSLAYDISVVEEPTILAKASSKWELMPRRAAIRLGAGQLERNEQMFLLTLLSLYNPREAMRLRRECGLSDFPDLTLLDPVWRELLSELFLTSTEW